MFVRTMRCVLRSSISLGMIFVASVAGAQGLVVDATGKVGIGTSSPVKLLEVNSGSTGGVVFGMATTGNNLRYTLATGSAEWVFANQTNTKLRIRETAGPIAFELDTAGNLVLSGAVTATGFNPPSARATKTDIAPVDEREILAAMNRLPVFKWRYKTDERQESQVGPMAEDFKEAFGIGDGKHLSLVAANGLSFAAIKGLNQVVNEKSAQLEALIQVRDAEIEGLRRVNAQFAERLVALENRVR